MQKTYHAAAESTSSTQFLRNLCMLSSRRFPICAKALLPSIAREKGVSESSEDINKKPPYIVK